MFGVPRYFVWEKAPRAYIYMKYANSFASFDTIFTCQQKLPGIRKLDAFQDPGPVFFWASHLECHEMTCGYKDSHILLARTWDEFGLDDFARTDDDVDNKAQIKDLITCCLPRRRGRRHRAQLRRGGRFRLSTSANAAN